MNVTKNAVVRTLPDHNAEKLTSVTAGNTAWGWGQTNTGWYFVQVGSQIGYVRYEAAAYATQDQITAIQAQAATAAQQAAAAQAQAAQQAQIAAAAANQPAVAAGIVFIGDSRMVTLKDAVERNLGQLRGSSRCQKRKPARMAARHWDSAGGQDHRQRQTGLSSDMGVNDLPDADKYAKDVNYWAAVWSARGAQIYYASVNPVLGKQLWDDGRTRKIVQRPLKRTADSADYLAGQPRLPDRASASMHRTGVRYKDDTNLVLYQYYLSMIGAV